MTPASASPSVPVSQPGLLAGAGARLDALLAAREERGLRLWAPEFVALDRGAAPVAFAGAWGPGAELARLHLDRRALVVATDVERGVTRVLSAGPGGDGAAKLPPLPGFEGGLDPERRERAAQVVAIPLWPRQPGAAWPAGRYALVAAAGDRTSERVVLAVGHATSTVDPAAEPLDPESLRVWPPPDPAGNLPHYHELERSPAIPEAPGIELAADRVARGAAVVHGSFRARPARRWLAPSGAVVPLTLVLTGSEDPRPIVLALRLPSFDRFDPASPPETVTGRFALDLLRLAPLAASPQTYFLRAFTRDAVAGPLPVAVVGGAA